ncbi:hypothetical protein ACFFRR_001979 [Megaselia abdita]
MKLKISYGELDVMINSNKDKNARQIMYMISDKYEHLLGENQILIEDLTIKTLKLFYHYKKRRVNICCRRYDTMKEMDWITKGFIFVGEEESVSGNHPSIIFESQPTSLVK